MAKTRHCGNRQTGAVLVLVLSALACSRARADDWIIGAAQAYPSPAIAYPVEPRAFSIPPQPLTTALDAFGLTTGIQIFYNSRLAANRNSPGVSGLLEPEAALRSLLSGTGLASLATGNKAITLVLDVRTLALNSTAMGAPVDAPTLSLDTMQVDGAPQGSLRLYANRVQYAILGALQRDDGLRSHHYRADIDVWLTSNGGVRQSMVSVSGGDNGLDGAIVQLVQRVSVGEAPPQDLPQPIHVRVLASPHN